MTQPPPDQPIGSNDSPDTLETEAAFADSDGAIQDSNLHSGKSIICYPNGGQDIGISGQDSDKTEEFMKKGALGDEFDPDLKENDFRKEHRKSLKRHKTRLNRFRLFCGKVVNNEFVQYGVLGLIIINAILMGIATYFRCPPECSRSDYGKPGCTNCKKGFEIVDQVFLSIFSVELVLQGIYFGLKIFQDPWLVFDLVVVVLSWALEEFQIVRAFRIFRAFRLVTRIRVLRDLVQAIGQVIPRMTAIGGFLALIFYIFAVLFTELFQDLTLSDKYFETLHNSLFTCFEMMTLEWADLAREVMAERFWAWLPFVAFIGITGFIVFNLIIAVICDAVSLVDRVAREREAKARGEEILSSEEQLEFAQDQFDDLADKVDEMVDTQKALQEMIEVLATEVQRIALERKGNMSASTGTSSTTNSPTRGRSPDVRRARPELSPTPRREVSRRDSPSSAEVGMEPSLLDTSSGSLSKSDLIAGR